MKKLFIALGVLIVLLIIFIAVALTNLGPIIKKAVNTYGPEITRTEIELKDVDVSLFQGEASLSGFLIGNPEGFHTPHAMTVQSVHVNINEKTIAKDPIIIDTIQVRAPDINYEIKGKTDNFRALLENIKKSTGTPKDPDATKPEPSQKKKEPSTNIFIKEFILTDGTVHLASSMLKEKNVSVSLPDIRMQDIGKKDEGTTPAKAFQEIAEKLYRQIQSEPVRQALKRELKELGQNFDQLQLNSREQIDKLREKSKEQLDSTKESVKDSVKGLLPK